MWRVIISHEIRISIKRPVQWKVRGVFLVARFVFIAAWCNLMAVRLYLPHMQLYHCFLGWSLWGDPSTRCRYLSPYNDWSGHLPHIQLKPWRESFSHFHDGRRKVVCFHSTRSGCSTMSEGSRLVNDLFLLPLSRLCTLFLRRLA